MNSPNLDHRKQKKFQSLCQQTDTRRRKIIQTLKDSGYSSTVNDFLAEVIGEIKPEFAEVIRNDMESL